MIIDEILDRKGGRRFVADEFKRYVLKESVYFGFKYFSEAYSKSSATDREYFVKRAIIKYIVENGYNINIINFVLAVDWT
jgi:hypothetical protein